MLIIAVLILASGFFSLFAKALKAARKSRLQIEGDEAEKRGGSRGQRRARSFRRTLEAVENPDKHLAAARIWIIALSTLAAVLSGLNIERLTHIFAAMPIPLAVAACTAALAFLMLLFGEILPGCIARLAPENIAVAIFPLFKTLTLPMRPLFFLAKVIVCRLRLVLPLKSKQATMTEGELRLALMEGEKSGIVESKERTMVEGVFYLGDKPLGVFMTHRFEIQWLDINAPQDSIREKVLEFRSQRCFPVADGTLDAIIGAAYLEDIILDIASGKPAGLRAIMKKALFAPQTIPALKAFETFRKGEADFLFVMDEYGGFAGMASVHKLMEEIVGELTSPVHKEEEAVRQTDGSWLVDGSLNSDDAANLLSLPGLAASSDYHTIAGFVLSLAGELPCAGDSFVYSGCRFTVAGMDGNRIDKILITIIEE
jgi:putative hemolysin